MIAPRIVGQPARQFFPLISEPQDWRDQALCAEADPGAWFPEKGGSSREAKAICGRCEVRAECLEYALEHDERWGIWGGLSEHERRRLKPAQAQPQRKPSEHCRNGHLRTRANTRDYSGGIRCKDCEHDIYLRRSGGAAA